MKAKYTNEQVAEAVKNSKTWAGVYRLLTGKTGTSPGMQNHFKARAKKAGISFSHFEYKRSKKKKEVTVDATPVVTTNNVPVIENVPTLTVGV